MIHIAALNVPEAFTEMIMRMRSYVIEEETRNGPVMSFQCPLALTITNPQQRVLTDPVRDANPFFHVAEFCWMIAGSNDIQWIAMFNKRMLEYSDNGKTQHAAYGHRWRRHFDFDQVKKAITMLRRNPYDRRVVVGMWDPRWDLGYPGKDVPCNTHLYFRTVDGKLDATVMNRSNDIIWGMLGANAVHMTMLHELVALSAGLKVGCYRVVSTNAHIYKSVPNFEYYLNGVPYDDDVYFRKRGGASKMVPLLAEGETYNDFVTDCQNLIALPRTPTGPIRTKWMKDVGTPIIGSYLARKVGLPFNLNEIKADDWRIACAEWVDRRGVTALDNIGVHNNASLAGGQQASTGVDSSSAQSVFVAGVDHSGPEVGVSAPESGTDSDLLP